MFYNSGSGFRGIILGGPQIEAKMIRRYFYTATKTDLSK